MCRRLQSQGTNIRGIKMTSVFNHARRWHMSGGGGHPQISNRRTTFVFDSRAVDNIFLRVYQTNILLNSSPGLVYQTRSTSRLPNLGVVWSAEPRFEIRSDSPARHPSQGQCAQCDLRSSFWLWTFGFSHVSAIANTASGPKVSVSCGMYLGSDKIGRSPSDFFPKSLIFEDVPVIISLPCLVA